MTNKRFCKRCKKTLKEYQPINTLYCVKCSGSSELAKERSRERQTRFNSKECVFCNQPRNIIHHLDLDRKNNDRNNLLPVCSSCHYKIHYLILKPFVQRMIRELKKERYTVIKISDMLGISRQGIYKVLRVEKQNKSKKK